jgi:predicted ATPase
MATEGGFLRALTIDAAGDGYPFTIPAIRELRACVFNPRATFFVGENGSGKSTLVEAVAVACGFNPEGGSANFSFATRESHSPLAQHMRLEWRRRPKTGFFLRAESFYNVATQVDELEQVDPGLLAAYGGRSLHEQSHGESFLSLVMNRFGRDGLYVLDEPEAALSVRGQLAVLARMHDLIGEGSQFVVATHSPLLLALPRATIYELTDDGLRRLAYEETEQLTLTRSFLEGPQRFLRHLVAE